MRLIDLIAAEPRKCPTCNGIGSTPPAEDDDEAMRVFLGEIDEPGRKPWSLCSKCEGIGRVFPDGKPARLSAQGTGAVEPPPPL